MDQKNTAVAANAGPRCSAGELLRSFLSNLHPSGLFDLLPLEVNVMILEHLTIKDLVSMEMTSKHFKNVIKGWGFWRKRAEVEGKDLVNWLNMRAGSLKNLIDSTTNLIIFNILIQSILGPDDDLEIEKQNSLDIKRNALITLNFIAVQKKKVEDALAAEMWKEVLKIDQISKL